MTDVESMVARADALTDLGRNAEAIGVLRQALEAEPEHDRALALLAYAHYHEREYPQAQSAALAAAAANPTLEMPHRIGALALLASGRWADAKVSAEEAVALAPHSWLTHVAYAQVLKAGGRRTDALRVAVRAVSLGPDEPDTHLAYADVAAELGMGGSAERAYRRVLELRPDDAVARHDLAVLQMQSRRYAEAVAGFASAASADPNLRVAKDNLVTLAWRIVATIGLGLAGVLLLTYLAAAAREVLTSVPSRMMAVAGVAGFAGAGAFVAVRTPRSLRPFAFSLRRIRPKLVFAAGFVVLVALALALYAVWPNEVALQAGWAAVAAATVLVIVDRFTP